MTRAVDLSKDLVLKENYTFMVADENGQVVSGEHGLYNRDTRFLSRYRWRFGDAFQTLLAHTPRPDRFVAHYAHIEGPSQLLGIRRELELAGTSFIDRLLLENTSRERRTLTVELEVAGDFADIFEARGWRRLERSGIRREADAKQLTLTYRARDGLELGAELTFEPRPDKVNGTCIAFTVTLEPAASLPLEVRLRLDNPLESDRPGIAYGSWRRSLARLNVEPRYQDVLARAIDDLRALLLFTRHGMVPAAGIPWYVAAFGRDALLTAMMLLPLQPEVAEGTLRYLAHHQGDAYDPRTAKAPGKIMHELRYGELTRTGETPFHPYYGTVDATPLFVMLLHAWWRATGDASLLRSLRPHWEAALRWMTGTAPLDGDPDGDGFLEFPANEAGVGLTVQSWKDSHDSMSHADGRLARAPLAVSEVQGYAYAAYLAAADFYEVLAGEAGSPTDAADRDTANAAAWRERAEKLRDAFHDAFWLESLGTYAMALDADKEPLAVQNSDAGQLLWTGIVPEAFAPRLVQTLFRDENWSGWGVRTLGSREARYNPVSYHNGSVWPHDNALIAAGLARYGFFEEARRIRRALFDMAASQPDKRLPELVAGYPRTSPEGPGGPSAPPVPYPVACRPQAWDAAALLFLLQLEQSQESVPTGSPQLT